MFSRFVLGFAISVLAVGVTAGGACAHDAREIINAVTITTYPPFESKDLASNKLVGFDIDIVDAIAAKMGAKVNWIESSFDQVVSFNSIKTKRADIAIAVISDVPERHAIVSILDYMYFNRVFYTLSANAERFANMDALCGKNVGAARGSATEMDAAVKWSEENCTKVGKPAITLVPGENTPQVRLMLQQNRIDAAITGAAPLAYQNTLGGNKFARIGEPVVKVLTGMAFSKDDPKFGNDLKKALAALLADGTYSRLLRKWSLSDDDAIQQPMINGQP